MNPGEHEVMARAEEDLWWYRGLRDVLARTVTSSAAGLPAHPRVVDAGCGTGQNLAALNELLAPSYLGGFDVSEEALQIARRKTPVANLYRGDICDPPLPEGELDLVISLDVVYIPGVERALQGLRQLVGALRPRGLFVLNLPAYDWLYSEHDVAIHTSERYTAGRVHKLLTELGLQIEVLTYRLCLLFPLVVVTRLPTLFRQRRTDAAARSDLKHVPRPLVNDILFSVLRMENSLIERGVRFPFGSSVYAVGRKE